MRSIIGVFEQLSEAQVVVDELVRAGFNRDGISLVAHRAKCAPSIGPLPTLSSAGSLGGAAAVGGLGGFAAGIVALAVPGIGPILAAGPVAAELIAGGIGTLAGGLVSWLRQNGVPEDQAGTYCEAVRRGGFLLITQADEEQAEQAVAIIGEHRLIDMDAATLDWHRAGWTEFDPKSTAPASNAAVGLPFDPETLKHSVRKERAERRAVRSYVRIS